MVVQGKNIHFRTIAKIGGKRSSKIQASDYQTLSKNIAIYGHHLSKSTAMFSTLMNYKREDYWRSHQTIQLDTIYGKRT